MLKTLRKLNVKFPKGKLSKSDKSLEDMLEAAHIIVTSNDQIKINVRELAKISGYSTGALFKRSGGIENIFLHAIAHVRSAKIKDVTQKLIDSGPDRTVHELAEDVVDCYFDVYKKFGVAIIKYYEERAVGRTKKVSDVHAYTDECLPEFRQIVAMNKTNTFREINDFEMKYIARIIFTVLEQPLIEDHPQAGTLAHKEMAVSLISRLLTR